MALPEPLRFCSTGQGVWRLIATHNSDPFRWSDVHSRETPWRCTLLHVVEMRCRCVTPAVPMPPATTAATPMRHKARHLAKLGRSALRTCGGRDDGRRTGVAVFGRGVIPLGGRACDAAAWRRQSRQTPRSPGPGVYSAPQLEHPTTDSGVFMAPLYRVDAIAVSAGPCDADAPLPTVAPLLDLNFCTSLGRAE